MMICNLSYAHNTRDFPTDSKCYKISGDLRRYYIDYCEMSNGDICYRDEIHSSISCFKG
jgi:hypothetical protein